MLHKIECNIKPYKLDDVKEAIQAIGIRGITVTEVKVCGSDKGLKEIYRRVAYNVDFLPKLKIEIVTTEEQVDRVIETILLAVRNGKISDDKIYIMPIQQVVQIRTGKMNESAV